MGILLTIAGIIVAIYTVSSVMGLWLSYKMMDALADGEDVPDILDDASPHHIEMISHYARGWRRHAWALSIIALFTTLIAMLIGSPLAFWALGVALMIDSVLFVTFDNIKSFVAQTDVQERLLDTCQCLALLASLALLLWVNLRAGEIIQ
ncbi:MAG: hypothetical protein HC777_03800 [Hyphomonadaceae bacterium]|nr:hypothetical protein [Hyphomonadaceae bacterium]